MVSSDHPEPALALRTMSAPAGDVKTNTSTIDEAPNTNGTPLVRNGGAYSDLEDGTNLSSDEDTPEGAHLTVNSSPKPRKVSEKKRADNAAFDSWLEKHREALSKGNVSSNVADRSVGWLVKDFESQKIITSPRDYQLELFEVAKTRNTIAVLDTGSGKTLIAALLLRWTMERELEDRTKGKAKRISFFLVDKVALVFQQYAVLECNLDAPIQRFCGATIDRVQSKAMWAQHFEENMIIVCTAEILYQCFHHSFIRMEQINLLIFDEAHHTKKNHPYARIIKDFYFQNDSGTELRPRILGMTASPVDAQVDVLRAAMELETLLHSQIATPSDPSLLQRTVCKPKAEKVVQYSSLPRPFETTLYQSLRKLLGGHDAYKKAFVFTKEASSQLGPWCADWFWHVLFKNEDVSRLEAKTERNFLRNSGFSAQLDTYLNEVRQARQVVEKYSVVPIQKHSNQLSSKVSVLLMILEEHYSQSGLCNKCIIFVQQRFTAMVLADLLQQPGIKIPNLNVGILVGAGTSGSDYEKINFKEQLLTIHRFKSGELNCLFATSIAEEGLDIPDCNLVIRFDLYNTMIQYIQSRGRARHENSKYIHMVEHGNSDHQRKLVQNGLNEQTLREFCKAMPEDRKLRGNDVDMEYLLRKERNQPRFVVKSTGAVLNYKQSLIVLAQFVATLPHPDETTLTPDFAMTTVPGGFQCEVLMPSVSPVRSATGGVHSTKQVAKCSAAFEMCIELVKGKHLNDHLQPIFTKQLPAMRNARLAISSKKKAEYNMRTKPEIWSALGIPEELHLTALTLSNPPALGRASRPLLLISRQAIPQLGHFPLFFGRDRSSRVHCIPLKPTLRVDSDTLASLTCFTLKIFHDVFSKEYEATAADLPYFLGPSANGHEFDFTSLQNAQEVIDWETVTYVKEHNAIVFWGDESDEFYEDKYVTDPYDGSRKFYLRRHCKNLKPRDPVPAGVVMPSHRAWRECEHDILNYSISLWTAARSKRIFRDEQPVVEAELLSLRRNLLDDNVPDEEVRPQKCFLVLEPLHISPLPVDVVAMAYNFPAIIYRINSNLVALDACRMLKLDIRPELALEAMTKDSDNTNEHDEEQINFQAGMGNNYERLEFLGDCFLKLATTVSLYTLIPDKNEFDYHVERMCLICNKNLFNNALDTKLEEYIRSQQFDRRTWYPQGLTLKRGKKNNTKNTRSVHALADKSIADVCEALIGASYLTAQKDHGNFDMAIQAVTAVVKNKNHPMQAYTEYYAAYKMPDWQKAPATPMQLDMAKRVANKMGYQFKYPRLLRSAFMHPSYPRSYEHLPSYQRLEFLGDALLDMACVDYLFNRYPGADPQWLTEHKMAIVSNQFLGCLAVSLGFHRLMVAFNSLLTSQVADYVQDITSALELARDQAVEAGKSPDDFARNYWVAARQPPKCLPDLVEAYVGAVFVDSGYDYDTVRDFFTTHVLPYFADMALYDAFASRHPVTFLASQLQERLRCSEWRLVVQEVPIDGEGEGGEDGGDPLGATQVAAGLIVHGKVWVHALAASGRYAKIAAAKKALRELEDAVPEEFRAKYGCTCELKDEDIQRGVVPEVHGLAI